MTCMIVKAGKDGRKPAIIEQLSPEDVIFAAIGIIAAVAALVVRDTAPIFWSMAESAGWAAIIVAWRMRHGAPLPRPVRQSRLIKVRRRI